jgi:hypothetical protein
MDKRVGGPQSRSGAVMKVTAVPDGDQSPVVQPVAVHSTYWATPAHFIICDVAF